jgi:small multidrug resistance pump
MASPSLLLIAAIVFEVLWAVMLKVGRGITLGWPSAVMVVAYASSLVFLSLATKRLDLSLAYAVWTGSGAALVAVIGIWVFGEPLTVPRALGFVLVVVGLVVLIGFERQAT